MITEHGVKQRVEVIEQVDHLDGVTEGGDGGETHDVTEIDGHLVKILRLHGAASLESLCHRSEADGGCHASDAAECRLDRVPELTEEASPTAVSLFFASPSPTLPFSL